MLLPKRHSSNSPGGVPYAPLLFSGGSMMKRTLALIAVVFAVTVGTALAGTHGGKRHAAAPPPWIQYEGTLKTIGTRSIVLNHAHLGDITILLDSLTVITQGDKPPT